jgi:hypothetical protein
MRRSLSASGKPASLKTAQKRTEIAAQLCSSAAVSDPRGDRQSALSGLETALRLVDDVDAALAAHDTIVPVTAAERFQ